MRLFFAAEHPKLETGFQLRARTATSARVTRVLQDLWRFRLSSRKVNIVLQRQRVVLRFHWIFVLRSCLHPCPQFPLGWSKKRGCSNMFCIRNYMFRISSIKHWIRSIRHTCKVHAYCSWWSRNLAVVQIAVNHAEFLGHKLLLVLFQFVWVNAHWRVAILY